MSALTDDMKRVVSEQQLGFIATVTPAGEPNLSPKGSTKVYDDDHLIFADICSPQSVANLRSNPAIEINVVDPIVRKGYRFKGLAEVLGEGSRFDELVAFLRATGSTSPIRHVVLVRVTFAAPVTSPAYDGGASEAEVAAQWEAKHDALKARRETKARLTLYPDRITDPAEARVKAQLMNSKTVSNLRKVMTLHAMLESGDTGARRRR